MLARLQASLAARRSLGATDHPTLERALRAAGGRRPGRREPTALTHDPDALPRLRGQRHAAQYLAPPARVRVTHVPQVHPQTPAGTAAAHVGGGAGLATSARGARPLLLRQPLLVQLHVLLHPIAQLLLLLLIRLLRLLRPRRHRQVLRAVCDG